MKDLPISKDHVAFGKNGSLHEIFFGVDGKTATLWKAPAEAPLNDAGVRRVGAEMIATGVDAVTERIKVIVGMTPRQIGLKLKTTCSPAEGSRKPRAKGEGKMSALDAAAQVLAAFGGKPMGLKELIVEMAEQGLWTSPGGKTPHATLYAAMIPEIGEKGKEARFKKVDRGQFATAA